MTKRAYLLALSLFMLGQLFGVASASQLIVYYDGDDGVMEQVAKSFKQETNIDLLIKKGKPDELFTKLTEDKEGSQADVYITRHATLLEMGRVAGLFRSVSNAAVLDGEGFGKKDLDSVQMQGVDLSYLSGRAQQVYKEQLEVDRSGDFTHGLPIVYRAEDDSWLGLAVYTKVLMLNARADGVYELKSVFDLSEAQWQGRIAAVSFYDESMVSAVAAYLELMGEKPVVQWLLGLKKNLGGTIYPTQKAARDAVRRGEKDVAWLDSNLHVVDTKRSVSAADVDMLLPDASEKGVGQPWGLLGGAVLSSSRNSFEAQQLMVFLLSERGQDILSYGGNMFSANARIAPNPNLVLDHVYKQAAVPVAKLAVQRKEVLELLKELEMP